MNITDLITPDRIRCQAEVTSKKRCLEALSELLAPGETEVTPVAVFDKLISRERLGSTGLGHGVALPHARLEGNDQTRGALLQLGTPVAFDAVDKQPVDLLFGLLVPEDCTDEHLRILSGLAEMFSDTNFCQRLRDSESAEEIYRHLMQWQAAQQTA